MLSGTSGFSETAPRGSEPIYLGDELVGRATSGGYGWRVGKSLALAYVDREWSGTTDPLSVTILGQPRPARILRAPPYDPTGSKLRG